MVITEDMAEGVAIRAWSGGDPDKIMLWGFLHPENRSEHIRFAQAVAAEVIPAGGVVVDPVRLWELIDQYGDANYSYSSDDFHGPSAALDRATAEVQRLRDEIRAILKLDPTP